jgi:hypothetical protein
MEVISFTFQMLYPRGEISRYTKDNNEESRLEYGGK